MVALILSCVLLCFVLTFVLLLVALLVRVGCSWSVVCVRMVDGRMDGWMVDGNSDD